jgi:hypothetical protein
MLRALCLAATILVLPLGHAHGDSPPGDLSANAALQYWQAFATMPKLSDAESQKLNAEYLTMPLDAHAKKLVTDAAYSLRMMRSGAALKQCDWAIRWEEEGIDALLPQMNAARVLTTLACVRARINFDEGRNADAIDEMIAAMTLGRHISLDGSLICILVGYAIENRTSEMLAMYLPKLDAKTLKSLQTRVQALPQSGIPAKALLTCEEKTLTWFARKVESAKDTERLLALLSFVGMSEGKPGDPNEKARAFLKECGGTADGILKWVAETRPSYVRIAKKMDLPLDEFNKEFELETKNQANNPVFKVFFPAIPHCRRSQARADIRRALFAAAIAVQLGGQDALKTHPDPVVGGSFEYVAFEGGFELHSKWKHPAEKPLGLTVGQRK